MFETPPEIPDQNPEKSPAESREVGEDGMTDE